jgi:hypothetical protein
MEIAATAAIERSAASILSFAKVIASLVALPRQILVKTRPASRPGTAATRASPT